MRCIGRERKRGREKEGERERVREKERESEREREKERKREREGGLWLYATKLAPHVLQRQLVYLTKMRVL